MNSMTNERTIQQYLRGWATNHKYVLVNAFIFNWESDFFSVTKTGTVYEVEVKTSRSDFKRDFGKEKHKLFEAISAGNKFKVTSLNFRDHNAYLFNVQSGYLAFDRAYMRGIDTEFTNEDSVGYWLRRERFTHLRERRDSIFAPHTYIKIHDLTKSLIPNRFFYACPAGLLNKEDVPKYAGLLHVDEDGVTTVKQAPFLHKRNLFAERLPHILLEKFWYLSQHQRFHLVMNNIAFKDCCEEKQER